MDPSSHPLAFPVATADFDGRVENTGSMSGKGPTKHPRTTRDSMIRSRNRAFFGIARGTASEVRGQREAIDRAGRGCPVSSGPDRHFRIFRR